MVNALVVVKVAAGAVKWRSPVGGERVAAGSSGGKTPTDRPILRRDAVESDASEGMTG